MTIRDALTVGVVAVMLGGRCYGAVINVPGDQPTIQAAIFAADDGDEIVVAPGTYNEQLDFFGDVITLRSSGGPTVTTIDGTVSDDVTVRCGSGDCPADVVIDGFTFRKDRGTTYSMVLSDDVLVSNCVFEGTPKGLSIFGGTPTIRTCDFIGGRGIQINIAAAAPRFISCRVLDTVANRSAVEVGASSTPVFSMCSFDRNVNTDNLRGGGAIRVLSEAVPLFIDCEFLENAAVFGGAICDESNSGPWFVGCMFQGNVAALGGGAFYGARSIARFANCTFVENSAFVAGGALFNEDFSTPKMSGCILWGNQPEQIHDEVSLTTLDYSVIEGGWSTGTSISSSDPLFVNPSTGDYHLQPSSPCIDAGANNALPADTLDLDNDADTAERIPLDLDGNPRLSDDPATLDSGCGLPVVVDMGAYEFQGNPAHPVLIGDVDGNGTVDVADLLAVLAAWGTATGCELNDIDFDGAVAVGDLLALLANWG